MWLSHRPAHNTTMYIWGYDDDVEWTSFGWRIVYDVLIMILFRACVARSDDSDGVANPRCSIRRFWWNVALTGVLALAATLFILGRRSWRGRHGWGRVSACLFPGSSLLWHALAADLSPWRWRFDFLFKFKGWWEAKLPSAFRGPDGRRDHEPMNGRAVVHFRF